MTHVDVRRFVRPVAGTLMVLLALCSVGRSMRVEAAAAATRPAQPTQTAGETKVTQGPSIASGPATPPSGELTATRQGSANAGAASTPQPDAAKKPRSSRPLSPDTPRPKGRNRVVVRADIRGAITRAGDDIVRDAMALAVERRAQALLLVMDTPGGVLESTRTIVQRVLAAPLPVIVYIAPAGARAGSAGVFIALAAQVTMMHPTSNIGAAHPVAPFGGDIKGEMGKKVVNDTAAWARSLAQTRGRNEQWAERAVRESVSLTAAEAVQQHVADGVARDIVELLSKVDGRVVEVDEKAWKTTTLGARVVEFEPGVAEYLYEALSNPALVYLLLLLGLLGLYIEFQHPGLIVPGMLGATALGIVLGVQVLPLNGFGLLLVGLAAVLFFAEVYVTSFGLLGGAGVVCLVAGSYLLFDVSGSTVRLSGWTIWSVALTLSATLLLIGYKLVAIKHQGATSGSDAMIGKTAEVIEPIEPGAAGKVFLDGSIWTATATRAFGRGERCRVVGRSGLTVQVDPLSSSPGPVTEFLHS